MPARRPTLPAIALTRLIGVYQHTLSHIMLPCCRLVPTCSAYAVEAIDRYGAIKGAALACWRMIRCNPFSKNMLDNVQ
jgi:putative membrane protein insertion efficiency factor